MTDLPKFTAEQMVFLAGFADNANNGRRVMCWLAHATAWVGTVSAVLGSIAAGALAAWTLWQRFTGHPGAQ